MECYAHSSNGPPGTWQRLNDHLRAVAKIAGEFAQPFGACEWGYLAGLWHDVGKYSPAFQQYLRLAAEACDESRRGSVDHSTAGVHQAVNSIPILGHLLGYVVAGHHGGLLDGRSLGASQEKRLAKAPTPGWERGLAELQPIASPRCPDWLGDALVRHDGFAVAFFVRMLFSCLVDADFLDTERAIAPQRSVARPSPPKLGNLAAGFFQRLEDFESRSVAEPLAHIRREIRRVCMDASPRTPGFFSLTVPTGGGKTLSSMAFALRHAEKWGLRRIVYVLPFTAIIEQNASVFRRFLGADAVLEHHSNLDPRRETQAARLAAENWDAPVIVTTTVQFYESLFANRPATCRKLHRLARSVIVLDEAQTLPVDYLAPCLRALNELTAHYGATVVLCTATQPAITRRTDFNIGLDNVREIMPNPPSLYRKLRRVRAYNIGRQTDAELVDRMLSERQVLCIVNTTRHGRLLFERLGPAEGHFHLSARMCPAHRRVRLRQIRRALAHGDVCRVVSTPVVEAGVDLDFPLVLRALAGLDSLAQAAGRCNRHNKLGREGRLLIFTSEHESANRFVSETANVAAQVLALHPDPLEPDAVEKYFRLYYWDQTPRWDGHRILSGCNLEQNPDFPFNFSFASIAERFHLLDDSQSCAVIVPWKRRGAAIAEQLRKIPTPSRDLWRAAQAFTVNLPRSLWIKHATEGDIRALNENIGILESYSIHYNDFTGMDLEADKPIVDII